MDKRWDEAMDQLWPMRPTAGLFGCIAIDADREGRSTQPFDNEIVQLGEVIEREIDHESPNWDELLCCTRAPKLRSYRNGLLIFTLLGWTGLLLAGVYIVLGGDRRSELSGSQVVMTALGIFFGSFVLAWGIFFLVPNAVRHAISRRVLKRAAQLPAPPPREVSKYAMRVVTDLFRVDWPLVQKVKYRDLVVLVPLTRPFSVYDLAFSMLRMVPHHDSSDVAATMGKIRESTEFPPSDVYGLVRLIDEVKARLDVEDRGLKEGITVVD
jgi:hypothetical protein